MFLTFLLPYLIIYTTLKYSPTKDSRHNYTSVYAGIDISPEEANKYESLLQSYLEKNRPYLNSTLSLKDLAQAIDISPRYLSYIINSRFKKSFFDLINGLRIEEAKNLLIEKDSRKNILDICYESGFNSKSAFNSAFKKFAGTTPSKFKNKKII